jgi:hypothetical protein
MYTLIFLSLFACAGENTDDNNDNDDSFSENGADFGDGANSNESADTDQLWTEAIADHQFKYLYNASDYSEEFRYHFCADGTGSYAWSIYSGGSTGTGSQRGGDEGTWEIIESNEEAVNIRVVGETDGEGYLQIVVDTDGKFYIDEERHYREHLPC